MVGEDAGFILNADVYSDSHAGSTTVDTLKLPQVMFHFRKVGRIIIILLCPVFPLIYTHLLVLFGKPSSYVENYYYVNII